MKILEKNMSVLDIGIRVSLSIILFGLFFTNTLTGTIGFIDLGIAILFTITSVIGFCPFYKICGITSCPNKKVK